MVAEIGAGTLPLTTFRRYFQQNILYLEDYARCIGLLVARAPDRAALDVLIRFGAQIVTVELPANLAFLVRSGGDPLSGEPIAAMHDVTYAYTRHLLSACSSGLVPGLAAMLPCQWSYGELAQSLVVSPPAEPIYADWIGLFGDPDYDELVATTTGLLDRLVGAGDTTALERLRQLFDRSIRYEVQFWDMAYRPSDPRRPSREAHTESAAMTNRIIIEHGAVLTMNDNDDVVFDGTVVIEGDRIVDLGPATELAGRWPTAGAKVIDATGRAVMPGLIDLHYHTALGKGWSDHLPLWEYLDTCWYPLIRALDHDAAYWAALASYAESIKGGVTTVNDMYRQLAALGEPPRRSVSGLCSPTTSPMPSTTSTPSTTPR